MILPISNNKFNIYDIFHNDNNNIVIIMPPIKLPQSIHYITKNKKIKFKPYLISKTKKTSYNFILLKKTSYNKTIKIEIDNEIIEINVNKYPEFKNEIIMSTIVKDEDAYIKQWIEFNLKIGIQRFIIYDNSENNTLEDILKKYIEDKKVLLIKWIYPYRLFFNRAGGPTGQITQQNHSLYAFRNSKYIGFFDIDEYINMQKDTNIDNLFNRIILENKININNIGSFKLCPKVFHNPFNKNEDGYEFLKIYNCAKINRGSAFKHFVIPKNVNLFRIHAILKGKNDFFVSDDDVYFNHYVYLNKSQKKDWYLNGDLFTKKKLNRGKRNTRLIDNSIIKHLNNLNIQ